MIAVAVLVSVTVALQAVGAFTVTVPGKQVSVVIVVRCVAVTLAEVELVPWFVSPLYVAVMTDTPSEPGLGVNVTTQTVAINGHGFVLNVPGFEDENETVPVGVIAVPGLVSVTPTVHNTGAFTTVLLGEQLIVVLDNRFVTVSEVDWEFAGWSVSPL